MSRRLKDCRKEDSWMGSEIRFFREFGSMIYCAYWRPDWMMRSELGCSLVNCGTELVGFIANQISVEAISAPQD